MFFFAAPETAFAQAYQRIAPQTVNPGVPPVVTAPSVPAVPVQQDNVILSPLRGVVFLSSLAEVRSAGVAVPGIKAGGVDVGRVIRLDTPLFVAKIAPFIGKPLTFSGIFAISSTVRSWYAAAGHPFVDVVVPPQDVASGVIQVVVSEYRLGGISVTGNKWFSSSLTARQSGLHPGQILTLAELQDDLYWLNQNIFRQVDAVFGPGKTAGTTDITLQTQDELPVRLYAGYDNQGVPELGRDEWDIGANWANAFGLDQLLSYQLTRSVSGRYTGNAVNWEIPLAWRDTLEFFGSYEQERPESAVDFTLSGDSAQASFRYIHPFGGPIWFHQQIEVGYDFKTTNNNLDFGGINVSRNAVEIDQFPVIYIANVVDTLGQTHFENTLVMSPGNMTAGNKNAAFAQIQPGAAASYVYDQVGLTRVFLLPAGFTSTTRGLLQRSSRNLLDSEQVAAGGFDSVIGYDTDTGLGSNGELFSEDIKGPPFSIAGVFDHNGRFNDESQLGIFYDYADLSQVRAVPGLRDRVDLASAGVDFRAEFKNHMSVHFALGWQLRNAPGTGKHGAFGDITVTLGS